MNILLLRPNTHGYATPPPDTPSGLMYLAGSIRWMGDNEVEIRDLDHEPLGNIDSFDAVGITILSKARQNAFKLIRKIRDERPRIKIIVGGPHASSKPELLLRDLPVDAVVVGEGEIEILTAMRSSSRQIFYGTQCGIDTIPYPAYDLVDLDRYYMQIARNNPDWVIDGLRMGDLKYAPMIASRGCPGRCTFCNAWKNWGLKIRRRSAEKVVTEMEMLQNRHGVSLISFNDNCFPSTKSQGMDICLEIQRRGLKMLWKADTRGDVIDAELAVEMRNAGCFMVAVGLESASPKILGNINKKLDLDKAGRSLKAIKEAGLICYVLLMVGNPGESEETIRETAAFVSNVKPHLTSWVRGVMVLPDTELCEMAGVTDDFWSTGDDLPYYLKERTMEELDSYVQILQGIEKDPLPDFGRN